MKRPKPKQRTRFAWSPGVSPWSPGVSPVRSSGTLSTRCRLFGGSSSPDSKSFQGNPRALSYATSASRTLPLGHGAGARGIAKDNKVKKEARETRSELCGPAASNNEKAEPKASHAEWCASRSPRHCYLYRYPEDGATDCSGLQIQTDPFRYCHSFPNARCCEPQSENDTHCPMRSRSDGMLR